MGWRQGLRTDVSHPSATNWSHEVNLYMLYTAIPDADRTAAGVGVNTG